MNTVQLECFLAVAEHLNFSKASRVLKITQPAVSHQIQALEEELDVKLFVRTSKSVTLTREGMLFLPDAQLILKTARSAKTRLGIQEDFLPLNLGCHNYPESGIFPPVLKKLYAEYPLLRPNVHIVPFVSLLSLVENDQLQASLSIKNEQKKSSLKYRELCSAPLACVCPPDHPLTSHDSLVLAQLEGNFIAGSPRQLPEQIFRIQSQLLLALPPKQRFFTDHPDSIFTLVKSGMGYTLAPDIPRGREPGLCYIPVTDLPRVSYGVYYKRDNDHPVMKRFLSLLAREFSPEKE